MQPCHVILRYSLCQTKLHANVHFFSFLFQMWALWCLHASVEPLIEPDRDKVGFFFFLFYAFWFVFFFSLYSYFLPLYFYADIIVPHFLFFHPEILLPKWGKKGCLGHFSPCFLVCFFYRQRLVISFFKGVRIYHLSISSFILYHQANLISPCSLVCYPPQVLYVCSCTVWSNFWVHKCDSGWHVGYVVRPRWILTCFGLLICLLGNQAYTFFFFIYSFFKQFSCWSFFCCSVWWITVWVWCGRKIFRLSYCKFLLVGRLLVGFVYFYKGNKRVLYIK